MKELSSEHTFSNSQHSVIRKQLNMLKLTKGFNRCDSKEGTWQISM